MQDEVFTVGHLGAPQADPHRRETVRVPVLHQGVLPVERSQLPPADSHRREAVHMRRLRTGVQAKLRVENAQEDPPGKGQGRRQRRENRVHVRE